MPDFNQVFQVEKKKIYEYYFAANEKETATRKIFLLMLKK